MEVLTWNDEADGITPTEICFRGFQLETEDIVFGERSTDDSGKKSKEGCWFHLEDVLQFYDDGTEIKKGMVLEGVDWMDGVKVKEVKKAFFV